MPKLNLDNRGFRIPQNIIYDDLARYWEQLTHRLNEKKTHPYSSLNKKEAIDTAVDLQVICESLMDEIHTNGTEILALRQQIANMYKAQADAELKHEAFVAGLTHGFKIESGDI